MCIAAILWQKTIRYKQTNVHKANKKALPISIIIAYKNEEANLPTLIASLKAINYPSKSLEIILVNDYSTDNGPQWLAQNCNYLCIDNTLSPGKKQALACAIKQAANAYIVCTDADCELSENLLWYYQHQFLNNADMVLGPVAFTATDRFASNIAALENSSLVAFGLIAAANGSPSMANGANLGFKKSVYKAVGGYTSHMHIDSGDDELLMHDFEKKRATILPIINSEALVKTQTVSNFPEFITQRLRWASKVSAFPDFKQWLFHVSHLLILLWVGTFLLLLITKNWYFALGMMAIKTICDLFWFASIGSFFTIKSTLLYKIAASNVQFFVLGFIYVLGFTNKK